MDNNLPPGCSVYDLPGSSEINAYVDDYVDSHFGDLEVFAEWIQDSASKNFPEAKFGESILIISKSVMKYLLEFAGIDDDWRSLLVDRAELEYWESRCPSDNDRDDD
jgi:hypothetical protein